MIIRNVRFNLKLFEHYNHDATSFVDIQIFHFVFQTFQHVFVFRDFKHRIKLRFQVRKIHSFVVNVI